LPRAVLLLALLRKEIVRKAVGLPRVRLPQVGLQPGLLPVVLADLADLAAAPAPAAATSSKYSIERPRSLSPT
jgi:hypothetical protein